MGAPGLEQAARVVDVRGRFRERGGIGDREAELEELLPAPAADTEPFVPKTWRNAYMLLDSLPRHASMMCERRPGPNSGSVGHT